MLFNGFCFHSSVTDITTIDIVARAGAQSGIMNSCPGVARREGPGK